MLRKKYTVTKSLRLDSKLSEDLEVLSRILDRPQNELINLAIEKLLIENKKWFACDIIADHFKESIGRKTDDFSIQGVDIRVISYEEESSDGFWYEVIVKTPSNTMVEKFVTDADVLNFLREITRCIDLETPQVQDWVNKRMNYK